MHYCKIRREFVDDLFSCSDVPRIFCINFELLSYLQEEERKITPTVSQHIKSVYPNCCDLRHCIIPCRYLGYLPMRTSDLLEHCKLHDMQQQLVRLNCIAFTKTIFWQDYMQHSYERKPHAPPNRSYSREPAYMDVAYATKSLQALFGSVASLSLICEDDDPPDAVQHVSHVVLHNIATSKQPCLKDLYIRGFHYSQIVSGVSKFLLEPKSRKSNTPYFLKSLAVWTRNFSSVSSDELLSIISFQLTHLTHILLDFRMLKYPKTKCRLHQNKICNVLVTFLKQPRTIALDIDACPLPVACKLVEAFLTTPATSHQELEISDDLDEDVYGVMTPIRQPIPDSTAKFKSLKMQNSSSHFQAWFFNLSELKLKSLVMSDPNIPPIYPDTTVQIQDITFHLKLCLLTHFKEFLLPNRALKNLYLYFSTSQSSFHVASKVLDLMHCLSEMCQQQERRLEKLHVGIYSLRDINLTFFFKVVRDLSLQCGTTLFLSPFPSYEQDTFFSEEQVCSVLPNLSTEFKSRKIKKIVLRLSNCGDETYLDNFHTLKSCLSYVADQVELAR